ncbi:MAG: hypothetical protein V3S82_08425 [Dehalococcoidia bacterium]
MPARKRIIIVSGGGRGNDSAPSPGRTLGQGISGMYAFLSGERRPGDRRTDAVARAELMLPPPLDIARLLRFCLSLEKAAGARVVGIGGSWEDGALLTVAVRRSVSLLEVLSLMPGVAQAWEELVTNSGDGGPPSGPGEETSLPPVDQLICLRLREETYPEQFGFGL